MLADFETADLLDLDPVYVFVGQDLYLKQRLIKNAQTKLSAEGPPDFDYHHFDAAKHSLEEMIEACLSLPFMSAKKIVICEGMDDRLKEPILTDYVKQVSDQTTLILIATDKRRVTKFYKDNVTVASLDAMTLEESKKWLQIQLKKQNVTMDGAAQQALTMHLHKNMLALENYMNQLITYVGERRSITRADVLMHCDFVDEVGVFELMDSLSLRRTSLYLDQLKHILSSGSSAHEIAGVLLWHFKRLWAAEEMSSKGVPWATIARKLKMKEWAAKKIREQLSRMQTFSFSAIFEDLYTLEIALKNNRVSSEMLLQIFGAQLIKKTSK